MAKEWILNSAMNRFQLNFKRNVGAVAEEIRKCSPRTQEEWAAYYFKEVRPREHLDDLGRKLYVKITEVIASEVGEVTEDDCIRYVYDVIIKRTFDGYQTEITTVYGQLEQLLGVKIIPAPDEWDRLFNVDFFIETKAGPIGIQIKPVTFSHTFANHRWQQMQDESHQKFQKKYGCPVFTVVSAKNGTKKEIQNPEVIEQLRAELARISNGSV